MRKVTVEYKKFDDHIKGYAHLLTPWLAKSAILDRIIEEMRFYPEMKYLEHEIDVLFEENPNLEPYRPNSSEILYDNPAMQIPRGTETWFLSIYMEYR